MPPGPTWGSLPGRVPAVRQPDTIVAKNHLLAEEIGELNQRAILEHGGEISMEEPKRLALEQYQAFCQSRIEEDDALAGKEFEHKRMLPEWRAEVAEK
ncbi:MAG TPA: hypothetical protein PKY93_06955 [Methanothrix sp.]|nr:hypothetical protein [Methanothrix sp.]HQI68351.1 hypothetical protein [Methanothrix sp.]HRS85420.1 hypothetical protein [Methanothrix sp.]HRT17838.1 hypothetical protein [Methanothrix sp.]